MKTQILKLLTAITIGLSLTSTGCPVAEPADGESLSTLAQEKRAYEETDDCVGNRTKIAWLGPVSPQVNAFDAAELQGVKDNASRMKATVEPFISNFDPALQLQQCNQIVQTRSHDAIIIIPIDSVGIIPCVTAAKQKGIAVVATQTAIGSDFTTNEPQVPGQSGAVLTTVAKFGSEMASTIVRACGQTAPCNVVYLAGSFTFSIDSVAINSLHTVLQTHPNIKLVAQREVFWDGGLAQTAMQQILAQNSNIHVVATSGDQMTQGAELAVNAAQLANKPKLIGAGVGAFAVNSIRAGRWFGSFVVLPYDEGWFGAHIAIRTVRGLRVKDRGIDPVAERGLPAFMTTENIAQFANFTPQWPG